MLFCTMTKTDHNIIKKTNFLSIFQHGKNLIQFTDLKNLHRSENPLQTLTATNGTTNIQKIRL